MAKLAEEAEKVPRVTSLVKMDQLKHRQRNEEKNEKLFKLFDAYSVNELNNRQYYDEVKKVFYDEKNAFYHLPEADDPSIIWNDAEDSDSDSEWSLD